jgi:serine/threonine protein kinase
VFLQPFVDSNFRFFRDITAIIDKKTISAELAVSAMLSSLTRRGICPNFVLTRGVFTCAYGPLESHWGSAENKRPKGSSYDKSKSYRKPREPSTAHPGRFQYIRMELCKEGDAEAYTKRLPNEVMDPTIAQAVLFQIAFALHAAADRFSVKHYDIKLLNIFMQRVEDAVIGNVVLRYGSHMFALRMSSSQAVVAKLADYGTANTSAESTGQPVTIAQFTTLENTPPDYLVLGDNAKQGHGHDCFGLGLCMLHLFTGHAPYEEILDDVKCPIGLKKRLRKVWENENVKGYDVIRSVILSDVFKDEAGNIIDGEPDETLYDTLYRFLVLFGIPDAPFETKRCPKVWKAIFDSLNPSNSRSAVRMKQGSDATRYSRDCRKYSVRDGNNKHIAGARKRLQSMDGGMELLFRLCSFDPTCRASAIEVLNSSFMMNLQELQGGSSIKPEDTILSYPAFSTLR